jgi:endonuclease/exonuclease/phosphatase family metal-dependent hydrolase
MVLPALAAVPASGASSEGSGRAVTATVKTRLATYNIAVNRSVDQVRRGVSAVLPNADIVALQEINSRDKAAVLARFSGWSVWRQDRNWAQTQFEGGADQTPVMWRSSRFSLVSARAVRISSAEEETLNGEVPGYHEGIPSWVSVVRLWDHATHQRISVIDVHLVPGPVTAGRPTPGRPRTYALFTHEVYRVAKLSRDESAWGRVFTLGDFNSGWLQDYNRGTADMPVRRFRSVGMVSMWATKHPAKGKPGTHSTSLIDQVFARQQASDTKILFNVKYSDHYPAVATYQLAK